MSDYAARVLIAANAARDALDTYEREADAESHDAEHVAAGELSGTTRDLLAAVFSDVGEPTSQENNDTFSVTIELGNEAMQTDADVADALGTVIDHLDRGTWEGALRDANGNTIGKFSRS